MSLLSRERTSGRIGVEIEIVREEIVEKDINVLEIERLLSLAEMQLERDWLSESSACQVAIRIDDLDQV